MVDWLTIFMVAYLLCSSLSEEIIVEEIPSEEIIAE